MKVDFFPRADGLVATKFTDLGRLDDPTVPLHFSDLLKMLDEDSITAEYSFVNIFLSFYDILYMIIIKSSRGYRQSPRPQPGALRRER